MNFAHSSQHEQRRDTVVRDAFDEALGLAKSCIVRGKPFIQYKAIAYKLTDIAADIKAAKCMVNCCAGHTAHDTIDSTTTSDIELVTGETAVRVSVQAIRILGGAGIMPEYPVGRFRHDALVYVIGQGTSEIERNSVARSLM